MNKNNSRLKTTQFSKPKELNPYEGTLNEAILGVEATEITNMLEIIDIFPIGHSRPLLSYSKLRHFYN